jgi:hypothetical protein
MPLFLDQQASFERAERQSQVVSVASRGARPRAVVEQRRHQLYECGWLTAHRQRPPVVVLPGNLRPGCKRLKTRHAIDAGGGAWRRYWSVRAAMPSQLA